MRQAALQLFNDTWKHAPHQRPRVEFLVDLTSLEKAGKFPGLSDWMHVLNAVHGVHLVVLYICCGDLKLPWAFQIWRGKGTSSPAALALKLLRTIPPVMLQGKRRPRLHADGGFESAEFIEGVLEREIDIVIGVRRNRTLANGTPIHALMTRGYKAQLQGLKPTMYVSWACGQASSWASVLPKMALPEQRARAALRHVEHQPGWQIPGPSRETTLADRGLLQDHQGAVRPGAVRAAQQNRCDAVVLSLRAGISALPLGGSGCAAQTTGDMAGLGGWREPFGSCSPQKCASERFNWKLMRFSLYRTHFLPLSPKLQDVSQVTGRAGRQQATRHRPHQPWHARQRQHAARQHLRGLQAVQCRVTQ